MKYKELKRWVEKVLAKYEKSRNSDQWLTYKLYADEFPNKVVMLPEGKGMTFDNLCKMPDSQTITRIRRKFNEEGKYLATDPTVIHERRKKIKKIKTFITTFHS